MTKKTPADIPLQHLPPAATTDKHRGHGGSYIADESGQRTLTERTAPAKPDLASEPKTPKE